MSVIENGNVAKLRRAYELWDESKGSRHDFWQDLFAEEFTIQSVAGPHRGTPASFRGANTRSELAEFFAGIHRDWRMLHYTIDTYVASGDIVVARGGSGWEYRRTGRRIHTYKIDWWEFRDGKIVSLFDTFDTAVMLSAMEPMPVLTGRG